MSDVGLVALDRIHKRLLIDEPWTIRGDREFSWIGHRLKQTVRASKIMHDEELRLSRVTVNCEVVEKVSAPEETVLRTLARVNRYAVGSAYTYSPLTRAISCTAMAYVHDETLDWRSHQLASFTILQLCLAETEADYLADKTRGEVALRKHPTSGVREDIDDMLNVLDTEYVSRGSSPSLFTDKFEMETIAETTLRSTRAASLGADESGLSLEVAFADKTSLTTLNTREPHRRLGHGLTVRLNLPLTTTCEEADAIVASLNNHESQGSANSTHYGAWCWDDWPRTGVGIAYQLFIPNGSHRPGIAQDVAYSMIKRSTWVDRTLNGRPANSSVWRTLANRYGWKVPDPEAD